MAVNILSGVVVGRPSAGDRLAKARRFLGTIRGFMASATRAEAYEWTLGPERGQDYWLDALHPADHPRDRR